MPARDRQPVYKETRLQQLRSFCETARLGSLAAAAKSLGLAQPTVWKQVHALEQAFGATLLEPHARGCRLTEDGELLLALAAPSVASFDALWRGFEEARAKQDVWLTVAATQRILTEDLAGPLRDLERLHPHLRLRLRDVRNVQIPKIVESGDADVGVMGWLPDKGSGNPWLVFDHAYEVDLLLVARKDHPLARRKQVLPRHLLGHPLVNSSASIGDPAVRAAIEKFGLFQKNSARVVAEQPSVIRQYVEMGFGIGLIAGSPTRNRMSRLHERSMSRYFGNPTVTFVWRRGLPQHGLARRLMETIRRAMKGRAKSLGPDDRAAGAGV